MDRFELLRATVVPVFMCVHMTLCVSVWFVCVRLCTSYTVVVIEVVVMGVVVVVEVVASSNSSSKS